MFPSECAQRTLLRPKGCFCGLLIPPLARELRQATSSSLRADTHCRVSYTGAQEQRFVETPKCI